MAANEYIIGRLPGLNNLIDSEKKDFENQLIRNIDIIELTPAYYRFDLFFKIFKELSGVIKTTMDIPLGAIDNSFNTNSEESFNNVIDNAVEYINSSGIDNYSLYTYSNNSDSNYAKRFQSLTLNYLKKKLKKITILASSDSTYNETFSLDLNKNDYLDSFNILDKSSNKYIEMVNEGINFANSAMNTLKKISPDSALRLYNNVTESISTNGGSASELLNILIGKKIFGLDLNIPELPGSTSYSSLLNIFFKLSSPTGNPEDIQEFIIEPLKLLTIMAGPVSNDGVTSGFPFIWNIKSFGNVEFNVGVISTLNITRGSMETNYSDNLQPLQVDIRMTLKPLASNFASIYSKSINNYDVTKETNSVGMFTPAMTDKSLQGTTIAGNKQQSKIHVINL